MLLSYSLGHDIPCEKLCADIQKVVTKLVQSQEDISSMQLVIDVKKVIESEQSLLPKIEHKNL